MKKKKIQVTDEEMRQRGEECSTFSDQYWCSMTIAQQEKLVNIRESTVLSAKHRVLRNEEEAGIRDKMKELRSRKSPNNEAIRDLYFAIPDEATRIKAINDLFYYESSRGGHDASAVLEAYYRFADVGRQLILGWSEWPEFKKFVFYMAILDAAVFAARLIWPNIATGADWIVVSSFAGVFAYGVYWDINLRRMESHNFLLWEIEKLRHGVQNCDLDLPLRHYELFSERERQSGKRSVLREIPW